MIKDSVMFILCYYHIELKESLDSRTKSQYQKKSAVSSKIIRKKRL